jgi:hypothetical protein
MSKYTIHKLIEYGNDLGPIFDEIEFIADSDIDAIDEYRKQQFEKPFKGFLMREPEKLIEDNREGHWEKQEIIWIF